jgi:hypothetical protein
LLQVHHAQGLVTWLALWRKFLTSVKGVDAMSAWIGWVRVMAFRLKEISVAVTDEDQILVLTMGLDELYKSFVISLDGTQPELLMLDYVIHCLLNEDVCYDNQEVGKVKDEVKPKMDKDNVALVAISSAGNPCTCWHCGKMGHIKAFCKEKLIHGGETREANMAFATTDDLDIWLGKGPLQGSDYEIMKFEGVQNCMFIFDFLSVLIFLCSRGVLEYGVLV